MSSNKTYAQQAPGAAGVDPNHPAHATLRIVDAEAGVIAPVGAWRKKFAICGFAGSSRDLAPFDDPEYYIVGLNQLYRHVPRADVWFDIHENWQEDNVEGTDHPAYLAQCGMPVFMANREPSIPTSVRYPLTQVMRQVVGLDYFTSTVAFMLSWAVLMIDQQVDEDVERAVRPLGSDDPRPDFMQDPRKFRAWLRDLYAEREIAIFGIDLIVGTEYDWQKACVEYILGLAEARGITLRLPPQCALLKQRWRYGYQTDVQNQLVTLTEVSRRQQGLVGRRNQLVAELQTIDGALQENGYWSQVMDLRSKGGTVRLNESS